MADALLRVARAAAGTAVGGGARLDTTTCSRSPVVASSMRTQPPWGSRDTPCTTAFSISGCSTSRGSGNVHGSGSMQSHSHLQARPRRRASIAR